MPTRSVGLGSPDVLRVYGNSSLLTGWQAAPGYRLIHSGSGKNAADLLLAIEAVELVLLRSFNIVLIASSDGDFAHLELRLRERGLHVIGVGEAKAPAAFRGACSNFVQLADKGKPSGCKIGGRSPAGMSDMDKTIRSVIAAHSQNGQGMRIVELSQVMHTRHKVRISTSPEGSWRAYLSARPMLYGLDPRGPDAKVRFKADGFSGQPAD